MTVTCPSLTPAGLLEAMFPGDTARALPSFKALGAEAFARLDAEAKALTPHLIDHAAALAQLSDINDTLKALRKLAPEHAQAFTLAALESYFSSPVVISALRGGAAVLFPHARSLPDIDYELLEPVLDRFSGSDRT